MDQKVRIYNVIANSGWLKCGPWAAVNLFECTKEGQSTTHYHIATIFRLNQSNSPTHWPYKKKWKQRTSNKMETKNLKYPLILLHLPQYFAHWHKIGNLQKHVETCENMFIQRTIFFFPQCGFNFSCGLTCVTVSSLS